MSTVSYSAFLNMAQNPRCPGPTGPAGPAGPTGPGAFTGPTGRTGSTGPVGPPGTPGAPGSTGSTGPTGTPGTNGATGATGTPGTNGTNGTNGATGPTGPTGPVGPGFVFEVAFGDNSNLPSSTIQLNNNDVFFFPGINNAGATATSFIKNGLYLVVWSSYGVGSYNGSCLLVHDSTGFFGGLDYGPGNGVNLSPYGANTLSYTNLTGGSLNLSFKIYSCATS
jgi:hypothetical protein